MPRCVAATLLIDERERAAVPTNERLPAFFGQRNRAAETDHCEIAFQRRQADGSLSHFRSAFLQADQRLEANSVPPPFTVDFDDHLSVTPLEWTNVGPMTAIQLPDGAVCQSGNGIKRGFSDELVVDK